MTEYNIHDDDICTDCAMKEEIADLAIGVRTQLTEFLHGEEMSSEILSALAWDLHEAGQLQVLREIVAERATFAPTERS
jgi:hypothetical protein